MYIRILIAVATLFLVVLGFGYHLTSTVLGERNTFEEQARQWAFARTSITTIDEIEEYRGKQSYAVVIGKNNYGTPLIAWLTADSLAFDTLEKAVPKENVTKAVQQGFPNAKLIQLVPGIDGNERFWEATLLDKDGRYYYVHYDFYSGQVIKSYTIQSAAQ